MEKQYNGSNFGNKIYILRKRLQTKSCKQIFEHSLKKKEISHLTVHMKAIYTLRLTTKFTQSTTNKWWKKSMRVLGGAEYNHVGVVHRPVLIPATGKAVVRTVRLGSV